MVSTEKRLLNLPMLVHREGWKFVAIFLSVTLFLSLLFPPLLWPGVLLTAWCAWFFRDPSRVTPSIPSSS